MKQTILLLLLFFNLPGVAQIDYKLTAELLKAIKEHKEAYEEFNDLEKVARDIDAGNRPVLGDSTNWNNLADKYRKASQTVKTSKLPTDINMAPYQISLAEMANCHLKAANIGKLNRMKAALNNAAREGNTEAAKAVQAIKEANLSIQALNYVISVYQKLTADPIYGAVFTSDLFDLLNNVHPDVVGYRDALNNYLKKLNASVKKTKSQSDKLGTNIQTLQTTMCIVEGIYTLTVDPYTTYRLTIKKAGASYTASFRKILSYNFINNLSINGPKISFTAVYNRSDSYGNSTSRTDNFSGMLDKSFKTITLKDTKTNQTFTLSK